MRLLLLVLFNCIMKSWGYSIRYYDCSTPQEVQTYRVENSCAPDNHTKLERKGYTILQDRTLETMIGFSCRVTCSTITEYCGSFSHNKLAKAPDIEVHHPLSVEQCLHMVNTEKFLNKDIKIGAETTIHTEDLGVILTSDNSISCRGQPTKIGNSVVNDILQVSQWKVIVAKEKFNINIRKSQVEVMASHEMLPMECGPESGGCQVGDRTFVWTLPSNKCTLEKVRTVTMEEVNGYLVDRTHKVLLKKGTPLPAGRGCPNIPLYLTEYPHLYLSETADWQGPEMGNDLDMEVYIKGRDDYLAFELEGKINKEDGALRQKSCEDSITHQLDQGKLLPIGDGVFMKRNGDTVEKFRCQQEVGVLEERDICYNAIPIAGGFVKPSDRVFTRYAAKKHCNHFFGLKVHTLDGTWVEINPHIKELPKPKELPLMEHSLQHEDLSTGGIYTEGELKAWTQHLEMGDYHDAVLESISYQSYGTGSSLQPTPFEAANNWIQGPNFSSPWKTFSKWIEAWGTYICLMALMIEAIHLVVWLVAVSLTIIHDGVEGSKALLYLLCCKPLQHSQRISRRHDRIRRLDKRLGTQDPLDTSAEDGVQGTYTVNENL